MRANQVGDFVENVITGVVYIITCVYDDGWLRFYGYSGKTDPSNYEYLNCQASLHGAIAYSKNRYQTDKGMVEFVGNDSYSLTGIRNDGKRFDRNDLSITVLREDVYLPTYVNLGFNEHLHRKKSTSKQVVTNSKNKKLLI